MEKVTLSKNTSATPCSKPIRTRAAIALLITLLAFTACALTVPYLNRLLHKGHGWTSLIEIVSYQFLIEGLAPLALMMCWREKFADYGYIKKGLTRSVLLGLLLSLFYDVCMSLHAHEVDWIPLLRQPAIRLSMELQFPLSIIGVALTIAMWGFLEGFFGIYLATQVNRVFNHSGRGWFAPGVIAFTLFNGGVHLIVGQGWEGFITSAASGYAITVVPALTRNAWGGSLVQTLTNAVGRT